jgi:hypothetical protein
MSKQTYTRIPNGGFNRAVEAYMLRPDELYDVLNLRPSAGRLTQTPYLVKKQALTTLYTGETASPIKLLDIVRTTAADLRYLVITEQSARYVTPTALGTQVHIPCILQTVVPNNATITGFCLMYGFNATDFAAAADTYSVVIQAGGATFKWNKNGGALSGALSIGPAESITANGLKVSFLSLTGYTPGDTWTWTRYNAIPYSDSAVTVKFPYSKSSYMTDVYIGGIGRNIMRVKDGFISSIGYTRTYGKYVTCFQNHLVVAHWNPGAYDAVAGVKETYDATLTPFRVGWSDLDRPDDFFATSVNEADVKTIPYSSSLDAVNFGITGMAQLNGSNWIYLAEAIHKMTYVGLPNVMTIECAFDGVGCAFPSGLVNTKRGHYFIGKNNFYFFDGVSPTVIGEPVRAKVFGEMVAPTDTMYERTYGYYDSDRQEVSWTYWTLNGTKYQPRQVVYQEKYGWWFFRNLPGADTDATGSNVLTACRVYQAVDKTMYGGTGYLYIDYDPTEASADILLDAVTSAGVQSYTAPYMITPDLYYTDLFKVKEADTIEFDANWTSGCDGLIVGMSARTLLSATPTITDLAEVWTPTKSIANVGLVRSSGSVYRFRFTFTPTAATKPLGCVLSGWGETTHFQADR